MSRSDEGVDMFGKKKIQALDVLFESLEMNSSNNYKDAAKENYQDILRILEEANASGKYPEKTLATYESKVEEWAPKMENYHHQNNVKSF